MDRVRFVMLSTHGDVHHVVVLQEGVDEVVLTFDMIGSPLYDERTWEQIGLATAKNEQHRARRVAEGLAACYKAELIVN